MKRILILVTLIAMIVAPMAVFAQTEEPEWLQYTSEDGLLTASYPAGWVAKTTEDIPFPNVIVVDSEETFEAFNDPMNEGPVSGQVAFVTIIIPTDFFEIIGFPLPEDIELVELTGMLATFFASPDEEATEEPGMAATEGAEMPGVIIGEAEEMDLADGVMGGYVEITDILGDGAYVVRDLGDGLLAVTQAYAASGEFTDEYAGFARQIAASVSYTGTAQDLIDAFMMPPSVTVEPGEASLTGEELLQERCTTCHDLARVDSQDKDEAGWTATVDRMISYGAQLNSAEREALIQYLVETH